jgi:hypothetical protein
VPRGPAHVGLEAQATATVRRPKPPSWQVALQLPLLFASAHWEAVDSVNEACQGGNQVKSESRMICCSGFQTPRYVGVFGGLPFAFQGTLWSGPWHLCLTLSTSAMYAARFPEAHERRRGMDKNREATFGALTRNCPRCCGTVWRPVMVSTTGSTSGPGLGGHGIARGGLSGIKSRLRPKPASLVAPWGGKAGSA